MKQQNEFEPEHRHEQAAEQQMGQNSVKEFSNTEDLLRYDSGQTAVPAAIAERLKKSTASIPRPPRSWWQRFFKG